MNELTYIQLPIHARINYKGYNEIKARYFGTLSKHGLLGVLMMAYDVHIHWHPSINRYYTCLGESNTYKGWAKR